MSDDHDVTVEGAQADAAAIANAGAIPRLASGEWRVAGFRGALARLRDAEKTHEPEETYIALFETLNWASSVGDWLKKRQQRLYPRIDAIDWIRGRVHHQWADAIELRPIFMGPIRSSPSGQRPAPFFFWHWSDRSGIPDADERYKSPAGEAAYDRDLAGRPVREALDDIDGFLSRLARPRDRRTNR